MQLFHLTVLLCGFIAEQLIPWLESKSYTLELTRIVSLPI